MGFQDVVDSFKLLFSGKGSPLKYQVRAVKKFMRELKDAKKKNRKVLTDFEEFLPELNTKDGNEISGTAVTVDGVPHCARKIRMQKDGSSRRDGYRLIYYRSPTKGVWFLRLYDHTTKIDLSAAEENDVRKIITKIESGEEEDFLNPTT